MYPKSVWLNRKEFLWAFTLFVKSIGLTLVLWLVLFVLSTLVFYSPEPLASTTIDVVVLMMQRVVIVGEKVGWWIAIFTLNTVATLVTSTFGAFLLLTLPFEVKDLQYRIMYPIYERIAKKLDQVGYTLLWNPLFIVFKRLDRGFATIDQAEALSKQDQGIWRLWGYSGTEFRKIFYILPSLIPALTAIVNGTIFGMVLAVNIVMGAYDGFLLAGLRGLVIGVFHNVLYFLSFTMPHGILELVAVFTAIALGHSFASTCSKEIVEHRLLIDHRLEMFEMDVKYLVTLTKRFLKSSSVILTLIIVICLLIIAAYIEVHLTPYIVERVLTILG